MTICKHGLEEISCLSCLEERNAKAITILIRQKEAMKKCQKEWKRRKRLQNKLELTKKEKPKSIDAQT